MQMRKNNLVFALLFWLHSNVGWMYDS
mgnify:CR=1